MSQLSVTTKQAKEIWSKGDRTIWELVLDYDGKLVKAKTFSPAISKVGWQGTVITENRPGRDGESQVFVKQPPKDSSHTGQQPRDETGIKAQMAVKAAALWVATVDPEASLGTVETVAKELFLMVERVKQTKVSPDGDVADQLYDGDGPVDLSKVKEVFFEED